MTNKFKIQGVNHKKSLIRSSVRRIIGNGPTEAVKRFRGILAGSFRGEDVLRRKQVLLQGASIDDLRVYGDRDNHVFFGYYDRDPFSMDERSILACKVRTISGGAPECALTIGYFEQESDGIYHALDSTLAWSWQQGAMLQWLPQSRSSILYNVLDDGIYKTRFFDISGARVDNEIEMPFYSISNDGTTALTCNFSRLARLRAGYGYGCLEDKTAGDPAPRNDGVWKIDVQKGSYELLISLQELSDFHPTPTMQSAEHYTHHFQFNNCGDRFLFIHLWIQSGIQRSRLLTFDLVENRLKLLSKNYVSHYYWVGNRSIIAYSYQQEEGLAYYLYNDDDLSYQKISFGGYTADGHCSFIPASNSILTDTYPDQAGFQKIGLLSLQNGKITDLAKFYSSLSHQNERRCDLHPRASRSGKHIAVDLSIGSRRQLGVLRVAEYVAI